MTKADLAIAQIIIGIIISATTLVIGFFMYRRGMRTRDVKLRVKAYVLWVVGGLLTGVLFFPRSLTSTPSISGLKALAMTTSSGKFSLSFSLLRLDLWG